MIARLVILLPTALAAVMCPRGDYEVQCSDECCNALLQPDGIYATRCVSDCSSFLVTTATPYTRTITITISSSPLTVNSTGAAEATAMGTSPAGSVDAEGIHTRKLSSPLDKRSFSAQKLPPYIAAACLANDLASRFSSACSYLGVAATTVMAPTPYVTAYLLSAQTLVAAVSMNVKDTKGTSETTEFSDL